MPAGGLDGNRRQRFWRVIFLGSLQRAAGPMILFNSGPGDFIVPSLFGGNVQVMGT